MDMLALKISVADAWVRFDWMLAASIAVAYFVVDAMYARYTLHVTKREPLAAASVGALMHFILAFGVFNYTHNFLYTIPLAIGSWFGTYYIVALERRRHDSHVPATSTYNHPA